MNRRMKLTLDSQQIECRKILFILFICIMFIFSFGCSSTSKSKIIGKWNIDNTNDEMMEFFDDGTLNTYTPYRFGPQLMYSGVKREKKYYKINNENTLEISKNEDKLGSIQLNIKFSDENSMTISFPEGEILFTLSRVR